MRVSRAAVVLGSHSQDGRIQAQLPRSRRWSDASRSRWPEARAECAGRADEPRRDGRVRGLVCGNYGECSPDVHEVLAITADGLAARRWRLMGARSATEARAFFMARLRRSLSVVIAREMARHRLRRIPFIGVPWAAIRDRPPPRVQQGVQHLPHMAQLADFMRYHRCMPPSLPSLCTPKRAVGLRDRAGWRSGCLAGCARDGAGAADVGWVTWRAM